MKILVNWDYNRTDLMKAFGALQNDIHFVFLYRKEKPLTGTEKVFGEEVIYWNDHNSPYEILDRIKPDKIVFHDIESFPQVSLNIAAKNRKIPTLVLEHGLRGDYEVDIALNSHSAVNTPSKKNSSNTARSGRSSLGFYLRSFRAQNLLSLFHFLRFLFIRKKHGLTVGLYKCPFSLREADLYINFTLLNASYILKRDQISPKKIISIGNPGFDDIFTSMKNNSRREKENYFLLIDAPYCEDDTFSMDHQTKTTFYKKLNEFSLLHNSKLRIKLHPQSYNAAYLINDPNIEYLREANLADQISGASGCFIINMSTLSPIAMYYSRCLYFNTGMNPYDKDLLENSFVPAYNFHNFNPADLRFSETDTEEKEKIKKAYLYATDGKATERLKQILLG